MFGKVKEKEEKVLRLKKEHLVFGIIFIVFLLYALTLIYPVVWMFLSSLKGSVEYELGNPFAMPKKWLFKNYALVFNLFEVNDVKFTGMLWNSIWMTGVSVVIGAFVSPITSYCLAKLHFPGRKLIYGALLLAMMLPSYGSHIANFKLLKELHIYNTPMHIIISGFAIGGYKFLILYSFFKSVSWSYAESAYIDGASHGQVFWKIMYPQAIGPILTFAITDFIAGWNDYMSPLMYMPSFPTLASGLYVYESDAMRLINYPLYFSGVIITIIPIIIIFICFQDTIMSSVSIGGIKG